MTKVEYMGVFGTLSAINALVDEVSGFDVDEFVECIKKEFKDDVDFENIRKIYIAIKKISEIGGCNEDENQDDQREC